MSVPHAPPEPEGARLAVARYTQGHQTSAEHAMTRAQQQRRDPRTMPIYSPHEVAGMLDLPPSTVTSWTLGMQHGRGIKRRFQPVIQAADPEGRRLSFVNLVEVHVLATLRRRHKVELRAVRSAVEWLEVEHPLASEDFQTNGVDLFVERYGDLVNASKAGQMAIRELVQASLERVVRHEHEAVRLFPFTRPAKDAQVLQQNPRLVAIDPRHRFGAPFLVGCGVDTEVVWSRHSAGDSIDLLVEEFGASREEVEEAIRFHGGRRLAA